MKVIALYDLELTPGGLVIEDDAAVAELAPFSFSIEGAQVNVLPATDPVQSNDDEGIRAHTLLTGLKAGISTEMQGRELDDAALGRLYELAATALGRCVRVLRGLLRQPGIDVTLRTMRLRSCVANDGEDLIGPKDLIIRFPASVIDDSAHSLQFKPGLWPEFVQRVSGGAEPDFAEDLLLDARAFIHSEDFTKAVLFAGMTAKTAVFALTERQLAKAGFDAELAESFTRFESVRGCRILLEGYGVITSAEAEQIDRLIEESDVLARPEFSGSRRTRDADQAHKGVALASILVDLLR